MLSGAPAPSARAFDPAAPLREIARRAGRNADERGVGLELLIPATLPDLTGDEGRFAETLLRMVEGRIAASDAPERLTLSARLIGSGDDRSLLISVTDHPTEGAEAPFSDEPLVLEALASLGAEVQGVSSPVVGRTTLLRFPL